MNSRSLNQKHKAKQTKPTTPRKPQRFVGKATVTQTLDVPIMAADQAEANAHFAALRAVYERTNPNTKLQLYDWGL